MAFFLFPMKEGERSLDIFKIAGRLALEGTDEFNRDIDGAKSKGAALAQAVGKGLGAVAKVGAAALAVASTAVIAVGKASLDAYAEYEQLVGGVDTLFKESSGKLQEYASQAFMTAGMSANEYMSTATSFSASLLQGLAGDTAQAVEYADMAIRDMSDNANKMGEDISRLQDAYQNFAKGQFQLLDNLKLGYNGTKTEMERLLKDANRINREHGITSNYTIESMSDIIEAIHVVQEEMGIYGTTAEEASKTITGSLNATKAAWKNLLVGFGSDTEDLGILIDNFVGSLTNAVENIVPRISQILGGIGLALEEILPVLGEELPGMLQELLPGVIAGAGGLIQGLIENLPDLLQVLWDALDQILGGIWNYISLDVLGLDYDWDQLKQDVTDALTEAWNEAWPEIEETWNAIGEPVWLLVQDCAKVTADVFGEKLPEMTDFFTDFCDDCELYWNEHLQPMLTAIGDLVEELSPTFKQTFETDLKAAVEAGFQYVEDMWNESLYPTLTGITDFLTGVFSGDWNLAWEGMSEAVTGCNNSVRVTLDAIQTYFEEKYGPITEAAGKLMTGLLDKIGVFVLGSEEHLDLFKQLVSEKFEYLKSEGTAKFEEIKTEIGNKLTEAKDKATEIFTNLKDDITGKIEEARDKVGEAIDKIKSFFEFEFQWPNIPLPHFTISPPGWVVGDLLLGIKPELGVEWYAKGGIMDDPTIFGLNGNRLMVGGEAGPEAIAPIDTLQGYVASAVASQNMMLVEVLDRIHSAILSMDENMGGHMKEALDDTAFKINNREFGRLVRGVT